MTAIPATSARPRARLGRYMWFQMLDYFRERGLGIVLIGGLIGYQVVGMVDRATRSVGGTQISEMAVNLLATQFAPLFVLLSVSRIVSADRAQGYYRMMFAKPVSVPMFYAQRLAVHCAGLMVCVGILCALLWFAGGSMNISAILMYMAVLYATMGGIGFLLSSVTRFDWPMLLGVWYSTSLLHTINDMHGRPYGILNGALYLLPPSRAAESLRDAITSGSSLPMSSVASLLGYGAICIALGLLVLRRRPLAA